MWAGWSQLTYSQRGHQETLPWIRHGSSTERFCSTEGPLHSSLSLISPSSEVAWDFSAFCSSLSLHFSAFCSNLSLLRAGTQKVHLGLECWFSVVSHLKHHVLFFYLFLKFILLCIFLFVCFVFSSVIWRNWNTECLGLPGTTMSFPFPDLWDFTYRFFPGHPHLPSAWVCVIRKCLNTSAWLGLQITKVRAGPEERNQGIGRS